MDLIVREAFGSYAKGARVRDAAEVAAILASDAVGFVTRVASAPSGDVAKSDRAVAQAPNANSKERSPS